MIVVAFVSFSLFNFVGDPVNSMTGEDASDERRAEVREVLGLNDPVYIQFGRFLTNIVQGKTHEMGKACHKYNGSYKHVSIHY